MKNIILFVASFIVMVSCSTPKYTYYFNRYHYNNNNNTSSLTEKLAIDKGALSENASNADSERTTINPPILIQEKMLLASSSNASFAPSRKIVSVSKDSLSLFPKIVNEFKATKKQSAKPVNGGDKSKNWFAYAGIALLFIPYLSVVGIVFCIIGLESEKRKLAMTGLIIFGILVLLGVVLLIAVLNAI